MSTCPGAQPYKENRCADCLFLDLQVIEDESKYPERISLHLTLNFNAQWIELPFGKIKFGLRGGELRLFLKNSCVPYKSRALAHKLALKVTKEMTRTQSREIANGGDVNLSSEGLAAKVSIFGKDLSSTKEISEVKTCQVSTKGSEDKPVWAFRLKSLEEEILLGLLEHHLCYVDILGFPSTLEAIFEVSQRDVWIMDTEGIWPRNISRNKKAILEREIVLHLLKSHIQPYLSRIALPLIIGNSTKTSGDAA